MLRNVAPKGSAKAVRLAREQRRNATLPERILWRILQERPDGIKFRDQHPTGDFIPSTSSAATPGW